MKIEFLGSLISVFQESSHWIKIGTAVWLLLTVLLIYYFAAGIARLPNKKGNEGMSKDDSRSSTVKGDGNITIVGDGNVVGSGSPSTGDAGFHVEVSSLMDGHRRSFSVRNLAQAAKHNVHISISCDKQTLLSKIAFA